MKELQRCGLRQFKIVAHLSLTPGDGAVALTTDDGVELSIPPSIVLRSRWIRCQTS